MPVPSIGADVHYVARGSADGKYPSVCRAAKVTEVGDDPSQVGLAVLNPDGLYFLPLSRDGGSSYFAVSEGDVGLPGSWHWPEPVGE